MIFILILLLALMWIYTKLEISSDKIWVKLGIIVAMIAILLWNNLSKILAKVETLTSIGYEKVLEEDLNNISKNELSRLIESKDFIEIKGVYFKLGEIEK